MTNIQQQELNDARKGTLHFLGRIELQPVSSFDLGLVSGFITGTGFLTDLKSGCLNTVKSCTTGQKVIASMSEFVRPIREMLAKFIDALIDRIAATYGDYTPLMEWLGEFGKWAVSNLTGTLADVIPGWGYVQNCAAVYDGVKKTVTSCIKWIDQVFSGYGVKLLEGGPTIMAESLARHNLTAIAHGLKDTAVASTRIGLQAAGDAVSGVGAIINALTGILQRIANMVGYCVQRFLVSRTLDQARRQWNTKGVMLDDADQFLPWFKRASAFTPIIPAMTLLSGFVGHPYRFLQLITPTDQVIDQATFDQGVKHIEKLKSLATDYARSWQDSYKLKFISSDNLISARLAEIS